MEMSLNLGDKVTIYEHGLVKRFATVERVTATKAIIEGGEFNRKYSSNGRIEAKKNSNFSYSFISVYLFKEGDVEKFEKGELQRKIVRLDIIKSYNFDYRDLSFDDLKELLRILEIGKIETS